MAEEAPASAAAGAREELSSAPDWAVLKRAKARKEGAFIPIASSRARRFQRTTAEASAGAAKETCGAQAGVAQSAGAPCEVATPAEASATSSATIYRSSTRRWQLSSPQL